MEPPEYRCLIFNMEDPAHHRKGFGARIYDLLQAVVYCARNKARIKLIADQFFPYYAKRWTDIFESGPWEVLPASELSRQPCWPNCPYGGFSGGSIELYAAEMQKRFHWNPALLPEIDSRIQNSGFKTGDIVLHLRGTDKVRQVKDTVTYQEASELNLDWFWQDLRGYLLKELPALLELEAKQKGVTVDTMALPRIFLCTDSLEILAAVPKNFVTYYTDAQGAKQMVQLQVLHDPSEQRFEDGYCPTIFRESPFPGQNPGKEREELLTALKNLEIMQRARFLLGGRSSYFFRIAELLRHPKPSHNSVDSVMFGKAEYAGADQALVRGCKMRTFARFVNPDIDADYLKKCAADLQKFGVCTIRNILRPEVAEKIYQDMVAMPQEKWVHAIKTAEHQYHLKLNQRGEIAKRYREAVEDRERAYFTYSFKRTLDHEKTCMCPCCRVEDSVGSFEFQDFLEGMTGIRFSNTYEWFGSHYSRGDFLSPHQDQNKGGKFGAALVFSFTKEMPVTNGGVLHFMEKFGEKDQNIVRSVVPTFNVLNMFYVREGDGPFHLVSEVVGRVSRYSITGWLSSET